MAQVHGSTIDPAGQYKAVELMGKGLVRLIKVGESPAPDPDTIRVRIPKTLARAAGAQKLFGESLDDAVARLLAEALKSR